MPTICCEERKKRCGSHLDCSRMLEEELEAKNPKGRVKIIPTILTLLGLIK